MLHEVRLTDTLSGVSLVPEILHRLLFLSISFEDSRCAATYLLGVERILISVTAPGPADVRSLPLSKLSQVIKTYTCIQVWNSLYTIVPKEAVVSQR